MGRLGVFLLVVGASMAGVWVLLLVTGQVSEIEQGRIDIWFHLAAEALTAALALVAGVLVLRRSPRASLLAAVALGAIGYTAVNSAGYYAESGDVAAVTLFGVIAGTTVLAGVALARTYRPGTGPVVTVDGQDSREAPAGPVDAGRGAGGRAGHRR